MMIYPFRKLLILFIVACMFPAVAAAETDVKIESRADVLARETDPKKAKLTIQTRVDDGKWSKKAAQYPLAGQTVTLRVKETNQASIRWYLVFPDITQIYQNATFPHEENPHKWLGYDEIEYHRLELTHLTNQWEIRPFDGTEGLYAPVRKWFDDRGDYGAFFYHDDVGSFWFQAEVEKDGKLSRSYGIQDVGKRGLSPKVLRVSFRSEDGYLGYLSSFFNVPGIFGSVTYQSNNYIGVDCADVLVAARGKYKNKKIDKNYNVRMLVTKYKHVKEIDIEDGQPSEDVKWGDVVRAGDFIAVKYEGSDRYAHIGALYRDADEDGLLSAEDTVLHAGPYPLHESRLERGAFDGHVIILRP